MRNRWDTTSTTMSCTGLFESSRLIEEKAAFVLSVEPSSTATRIIEPLSDLNDALTIVLKVAAPNWPTLCPGTITPIVLDEIVCNFRSDSLSDIDQILCFEVPPRPLKSRTVICLRNSIDNGAFVEVVLFVNFWLEAEFWICYNK